MTRSSILTVLILLLGKFSHAQIEGKLLENSLIPELPFTVTQFSTKDGLPQNQVIRVFQHKSGSLIIYTANGISYFDGYQFKPLIADSAYDRQFFRNIQYNGSLDLMVGCDLNGTLWQLYPAYRKINIAGSKVRNFAMSGDSLIVLTQERDVYIYPLPSGKPSYKKVFTGKHNHFPDSIAPHEMIFYKHQLFAAFDNGLYALDLKIGDLKQLSHQSHIRAAINPFDSLLYLAVANEVFTYNGELKKQVSLPNLPKGKTVLTSLAFEGPGNFFAGSRYGLYWVGKNEIRFFNNANGFITGFIDGLYFDANQNCLYTGTINQGLLKLQMKNQVTLPGKKSEAGYGSINSVVYNDKGELLVAQNCCNIMKLTGNSVEIYHPKKSEFASLSIINGSLYAGTWGDGIYIFKNSVLIDSVKAPAINSNIVHACFKDSENTIWVGDDKGLSAGISAKSISPILPQIKETVICFYERKDKTLCVGAVGCFYLIKNKKISARYDQKNGLKGKEVRGFYEDKSGKLWVCTYGGSLFCLENNKLNWLKSRKNCVLNEDVFCLAPDSLGHLYMSSNHGLWRIAEQDLQDFYNGTLDYLVPYQYSEENGILNSEFSGGFQNNFMRVPGGYLYFPSINGLVRCSPQRPEKINYTPVIERLYINDTLYGESETTFNRETNSLTFNFSCASMYNWRNTYFQHRLSGNTGYNWSTLQKSRTVNLRMLPPGQYTFEVRAIDGFNDRQPITLAYSFEIEAALYERAWFRWLIGTLVAGLVFFVVQWRIINVRRRTKESEHYTRKLAEIELKAIQSQLNPHFIFNCLNTIKYFILEKDFTNANQSLSTFSSLMRSSLENSDKMFVPFSKELKFVKDYIELEKLRLRDRLEYSITCNPSVNMDLSVPYLVVQPYVENAIKHGIANLEDKKGKLQLYFEKADTGLTCTITDNGIGREASRKLNQKNSSHVSKGTRLMEEKSAFLKEYNNYHCSIIITDLYTDNAQPAGTRVIIEIPLQ